MEPVANLQYRSASPQALWAVILLVVAALANSVTAISAAGQIQLLDVTSMESPIPATVAEARDERQCIIEVVSICADLLALIAFFVWVYRANSNAHVLCSEKLEFTPGWSVGWFFVPLAGLFMPYRVMAEIWRASNPDVPTDHQKSWVSPLLGVWWAVWVLSAIMHYSGWQIISGNFRLSKLEMFQYFLQGTIKEFYWGHLIAVLVAVALSVLEISVILNITGLQERKATLQILETSDGQ